MAIPDRMLTEAELQAIIDRRTQVKNMSGAAANWTTAESTSVRSLLIRLADLAIDRVGLTAEEHLAKMETDLRYRHFWRMDNDARYVAAFLYTYDPSFRVRADSDTGVYAEVLAAYNAGVTFPENHPDIIADTVGGQHPTDPLPPSPPVLEQRGFRGRNDDGGIAPPTTGASWKAAENTGWSQPAAVNFRVRLQLANSSANGWVGGTQLWCRKNGGAWQPVNSSSPVAKTATSPHVADGTSMGGALLSLGTYSTVNAGLFEAGDGFTRFRIVRAVSVTEHEFCLQLVPADVVVGDIVEFQLRRGTEPGAPTPLDTYSQMPVVTVA